MAHLIPHSHRSNQNKGEFGGQGYSSTVPQIVTRFLNHSVGDDDPKAEDDDHHIHHKKPTQIVGDVRVVNKAFSRLRIAEACNAYLGCIGVGICIIEREIRFEYRNENETIRIILLSLNFLTTLLLLLSLFFSYKMQFNWMKARGFLTIHDDLINTGMYKYLVGECCVCLISPMPFIYDSTFKEHNNNYGVDLHHWYNDIFLAWSFVRVYLVLRCILANSFFMSTRAQRVCQMNGSYASYMFSIK